MDKKSVTYPKEEKIQLPLGVRGAKAAALFSEKVKNSSPKSLSVYCRPAVYRQLTNSKPTLKNLTSAMTLQTLDPYRSIRISRRQLANYRPTVCRLSAACRPIVGQLLADCRPTVFWGSCSSLFPSFLSSVLTNKSYLLNKYSNFKIIV